MKKISCTLVLAACIPFFTACNDSTSPNNNSSTATGYNNVSGTITLAIKANGGRSAPMGSENLTKNENIDVNLSFVLPIHAMIHNGANTMCSWDNPIYDGHSNWLEETLTEYDCMGGRATDKDTVIKSYSTNIGGKQPAGVNLVIANDGSYQITIAPASTQTSMNIFHSIFTNCGKQTYNSNSSTGPGVPFNFEFDPFNSGAMGSFTGKTETANPAHLKGVFNGTDNLSLNIGSPEISFPYDYVVSWDLNMIK